MYDNRIVYKYKQNMGNLIYITCSFTSRLQSHGRGLIIIRHFYSIRFPSNFYPIFFLLILLGTGLGTGSGSGSGLEVGLPMIGCCIGGGVCGDSGICLLVAGAMMGIHYFYRMRRAWWR